MKILKKILQNKISRAFLDYSGIYFSMFGASVAIFWVLIEDKDMVYLISFLLSTLALIGATTQELVKRYLNKKLDNPNILDDNMDHQEPSSLAIALQYNILKETSVEIDMAHVMDTIECAEEELDEWGVKLQPRAKRDWVSQFAYADLLNQISRIRGRFSDLHLNDKMNLEMWMDKSTKIKNRLFQELQNELEYKR